MLSPVYLDYQATTPLDPRVLEAMLPWMRGIHGNPHSSEHALGWRANEAVDHAAESIGQSIGAEAREIVFTSGATESNNLAIRSCIQPGSNRNVIIVSAIEHPSVIEAASTLTNGQARVEVCEVGEFGELKIDMLREMLSPQVALVSVGAVNNEIGAIQDVRSIAVAAHSVGALFHSDCSQAPLAMSIDVSEWGLDLATFSSHKSHGPAGIGALYVSSAARKIMRPLIVGGSQQSGLRAGTVPTPLCIGFAEALRIASDSGELERARIVVLRDKLREMLFAAIGGSRLVGPLAPRHPGNLSISLPISDARDVVQLVQPAVSIATGSACHAGAERPSHVLRALGLSEADARKVIRIGLGRFTTESELEIAADAIAKAVRSSEEPLAADRHKRVSSIT